MSRGYKKFLSIIGTVLFLILLAGFQVSFVNSSFLKLNLFLIMILYLVLAKKNTQALVLAWLAGILTGLSYFSNFGVNSLVLLILAAILIILHRTVFLTLKTESIIFMSVAGVALYHFLNWLSVNILAPYSAILLELVSTTLILLIIFKSRTGNQNV